MTLGRLPRASRLCWVCVFAVCHSGAASPACGGEGANSGEAKSPAASMAELERRLEVFRDAVARTSWPAATPAEIAAVVGDDPRSLAAFVRRELRYEPYRGILRGAEGALRSGGGNSADLCLLLREMIRARDPGAKTRFRIATLSPEDTARILEIAARGPPPREILVERAPSEDDASGSSLVGSGAAEGIRKHELDLVRTHAAETGTLLSLALRDLENIRGFLVKGAGEERITPTSDERVHVWLEVLRDGEWLTLDPVFGLAAPQGDTGSSDRLPEPWMHVLSLKVDVERLEDGALKRESLIERRWELPNLQGKAIDVVVAPEELSMAALVEGKGQSPVLEQARKFEWFGVLVGRTGEDPEASRRFDLAGRTGAPVGPASPLGLGGVDPFRRVGRSGARSTPKSELTGLWVTCTLRSPGGTRTVERPLLDRIGPARRAAGTPEIPAAWKDLDRVRVALVQTARILVPSGLNGMERMAAETLDCLVHGRVLERAAELEEHPDRLDAVASGLPGLPADLIGMHDGALFLVSSFIAGKGIVYFAAPNLSIQSETLDLTPDGQVVLKRSVDIGESRLEFLGDPSVASDARLLHGLLLSEMEGRRVGAAPGRWAAGILRKAREEGIALAEVRGAEELASLELTPDVRATMTAQLERGDRLLVPRRPVEAGGEATIAWWRVDPAGNVVATSSDGRGGAASEGLLVLKKISIPMVKRCARFVACFNETVGGGGSMREAGGKCLSATVKDIVKESLNGAIDHFVKDPFTKQFDAARANALGPEYEKLYQAAKKAIDGYQKAQEAIADPLGQIPGVAEGRDAADAGARIGSAYGAKIYLLLSMGHDIAEYASSH